MTANSKSTSSALVRIGSAARRAWPWAQRARALAEDTLESWMTSLLGEDFAARLERVPIALGAGGVDPFGLDPAWAKYAVAAAAFLHRNYFRTEVFGAKNVPGGRVLLIANHSGQVPFDGMVLGASMFMDVEPPRFIRAMVEKWSQTLPFVSTFFPRVGSVVGVPENARRLLEQDEALLVFPEGARGISKTFDRRYQLTDFGLGFMRLAIETNTPIVPIAVIGGEEQYISVGNLDTIARLLRMPSFPVIPQMLFPGGQLPLPTKYRIYFGEPMRFTGDHDDDDSVIEEKVWLVKATIQSMLNRGIKARRSVFW
ncbi:lysophospholipid acyltransferase family protein [Pendulispora albinea]|uniref:Acyltransferase family protein n=1 Tax=Pendulispora albinea TaxID=2741071 RepID=A0ABZ2M9C8_9BACT